MKQLSNQIWAISQEALNNAPFESLSVSDVIKESPNTYLQVNPDGIGVLKIFGALSRDISFFERLFGGGSDFNIIKSDLERAIDGNVKGLLLHISSPGGSVDGTKETADLIKMVAGQIPVIAYTDDKMTSAAFWLGSGTRKIFAYPTAQIGSIGVVTMHIDFSGADEQAGIKRTYISNGKYKRLANDAEPLSAEGKDYIQQRVNGMYDIFVNDVAGFRGMEPEKIYEMESVTVLAKQALALGLVDYVADFNAAYNFLRKECGIMDMNEFKTGYQGLYDQVIIMGQSGATIEDLRKNNPDLAAKLTEAGMKAERERISEIHEAAFDGQEVLVGQLIKDGVSAHDAIKKLMADQKEKMQGELKALEKDDPGDVGAGSAADPVVEVKAKTREEAGKMLTDMAKELAASEGIKFSAAFDRIVTENPELNNKYLGKEE